MNRSFGVPAKANRLKAGLQTSGVPTDRYIVPLPAKNRKRAAHEPHRCGKLKNVLYKAKKARVILRLSPTISVNHRQLRAIRN